MAHRRMSPFFQIVLPSHESGCCSDFEHECSDFDFVVHLDFYCDREGQRILQMWQKPLLVVPVLKLAEGLDFAGTDDPRLEAVSADFDCYFE